MNEDPSLHDDIRKRALEAAKEGDYRVAQDLILALLRDNPRDSELLYYMGSISYKFGDLKGALDYWDKTLDVDPGNSRAQKWLDKVNLELASQVSESPIINREAVAEGKGIDLFPLYAILGGLCCSALIGFVCHYVGRFFWMPFIFPLLVGCVCGMAVVLAHKPESGGQPKLMGIVFACILAILSYSFIYTFNAVEFYNWGGAERLQKLQRTQRGEDRNMEITSDPHALLREQVGRDDLMGYLIYAGRVGRVEMRNMNRSYNRRRYARSMNRRGEIIVSGTWYWSLVAVEYLLALISAGWVTRKFHQ
jgi:tetratricopeptide (TPR) repeat protein